MPRLRNVLLTDALAALVLSLWMALHGCGAREDAPASQQQQQQQQQLAAEQQRREAAEARTRAWQTRATILGSVAVLTLVAGAALGSRTRRHTRRDLSHEPRN